MASKFINIWAKVEDAEAAKVKLEINADIDDLINELIESNQSKYRAYCGTQHLQRDTKLKQLQEISCRQPLIIKFADEFSPTLSTSNASEVPRNRFQSSHPVI
ncbi:unnamed protein product [Didymodactylos carnosus]|uniref:Uncharacterized protein n=1 Tax=Didymodactylos carnosus TaxID=1234261 RepID=A0A8S2GF33_9BILA|nr:unnamed protein product [Didymodactylos carnosus]CAF3509789.1 unnamed protein product [Didymodactylos carnosus]